MLLIWRSSPLTPSFNSACGVLAVLYNSWVARLTLLSVACADSTTATSNSNGVRYSSSLRGAASAARRRRKISVRWAEFMSGTDVSVTAQRSVDNRSRAAHRYHVDGD